jgi:hypothetical protein
MVLWSRIPTDCTVTPALSFPAMMVLNAAQAAGSFLIWGEVRKQTQVSTAQFEERRIAWPGETLAQLYTDMKEEGVVRLDTIQYLARWARSDLGVDGANRLQG